MRMQFEVEFYETVDGKSPAIDFLDSLEPKVHAKFVSLLELLGTNGFIKKTQKTPKNVIALAKRYREDYIRQMGAKK